MTSKKIVFLIALCSISMATWGQNIINSPYSRFGIGEQEDQSSVSQRLMGGMGSSWAESHMLNRENPASLPFLRSTAFETGIYGLRKTLTDANTTNKQWGGRMDYLALGFTLHNPINEVYEEIKRDWRWGMSLDLGRKTNLSYDITSRDSIAELGNLIRNYAGDGGTYEFKWSTGVSHKDFSAGVSLGYMFGNLSYRNFTILDDKPHAFNNAFENNYFVKGFTYNLGLMYNKTFGSVEEVNKMKRLVVGVRYSHGTQLTTIGEELGYGNQTIGQGTGVQDTIYEFRNIRGKAFMPGTFGIGANILLGNRYGFGVEFNTAPWSQYYFEGKGDVKNQLRSSSNVSIGGFIRPNYKSFDNYLKRMYYRYGFYYKQEPYEVNSVAINDLGFSVGTSLPFSFQRRSSTAHIGLNVGQKGKGSIIEENYLKINFGFTFNDDEWFIKRKYN